MPIILNGPGGGGAAGYVYPSGCVENPVLSDANGKISIQWADPDEIMLNGVAISEWKGTVIVCKQGARPQSVDDGVVVCESTVKNQHKESPLVTDVGGIGYYYGFFPYTKDYVVNTDAANVVYYNGGLLEHSSWDKIAAAAADGSASVRWNVGDEKTIILSGAYNMELTLQIAGFNHDTAGSVTFRSKNSIGASKYRGSSYNVSNINYLLRGDFKNSLPEDLRSKLKSKYSSGVAYEIFLPSVSEVNGIGYRPNANSSSLTVEGAQYPLFANETLRPGGSKWWTRSIMSDTSFGYYNYGYYYVDESYRVTNYKTNDFTNDTYYSYDLFPMFVI